MLEALKWRVNSYTDDGRVQLQKYSPSREDFIICVEVESFPKAVAECAADFDVDEHIAMWIEAKRNGVGGVPDARTLVHDAEKIKGMLDTIDEKLTEVKD